MRDHFGLKSYPLMLKPHSRSSALFGFTLIELLVVIAIIGILSAVVLASLGTARDKGKDATIKANLDTVTKQAALFYDNHSNNYSLNSGVAASGNCPLAGTGQAMWALDPGGSGVPNDANINSAIIQARSLDGSQAPQCAIGSNADSYAVAVTLKSTGNYYCVDSNGRKATLTTAVPGLGGGALAPAQCP